MEKELKYYAKKFLSEIQKCRVVLVVNKLYPKGNENNTTQLKYITKECQISYEM